MSRLQWGEISDKSWQAGLDRGVLYPANGPGVPWNGLISVDETGPQETNQYYVDGRLYLITVTPKEFTGSLSCFTYPDEFSDALGISEAADGLFLDGQVPDRFGLSYRTGLVDGAGNQYYKIHLIYGVMASISDVNHKSLSEAVDPEAFQFDLKAVPESVTGFRPTAHVILDTRYISAETINEIEKMLYGTWHVEPYMPPIQTFFDLMSFGEIVVIRDNGDGTWEAEGSRKYITVYENGEFQVSNVTVVDHMDGSYDVSDTTV